MKISDLLFYFNERLSFWQLFPFKFFKKKKEKEFGITNNFDDIFQQAPYRPAVEVTSMSYLPNTQIECYLGNINLFLIRESHTVREVKTKLGCYFNVPIFVSILWSYGEYKSNLQSNKLYLSKVKIRLEKNSGLYWSLWWFQINSLLKYCSLLQRSLYIHFLIHSSHNYMIFIYSQSAMIL